ncbi:hypothetical protein [Variovorax boronicumulans]|uniref:hypothetical protein n=1 Tax=Variovorax boronicumulans TaxID=436515 RepID=UPI001C581663
MDSRFEQWTAMTDEYTHLLLVAASGDASAWTRLRQLAEDIRALDLLESVEVEV